MSNCSKNETSNFPVLFMQTYDAVYKLRRSEFKRAGITLEQNGALLAIEALGKNATAADIARFIFREHNSISVLLFRLEKKGYIKKSPGPRGKKYLKVTPKGRRLWHKALETTIVKRIFSELPSEKQELLCELLEELRHIALKNLNIDIEAYLQFYDKFKMH